MSIVLSKIDCFSLSQYFLRKLKIERKATKLIDASLYAIEEFMFPLAHLNTLKFVIHRYILFEHFYFTIENQGLFVLNIKS